MSCFRHTLVAGGGDEGHFGPDSDIARAVNDLGAMEGVELTVARPYLAEPNLSVETVDLSRLRARH